ncbi:hypothetical protein HRR83_002968 [Exophiala dermatitidis]|uniref:Uncharacterized protein n=1 Tax=Exophiala dermatitidis TaxID=5970 RepID=A0AAN6IQN1_EXODE|nr:hypothetical protein HRR73_008023 [Exophiala dermatitidis]KAJ4520601.1 hypothetical protein HRR74_003599 [Exophiala dermatitidis]KAJ4537759.1 hypothetical protein HRR76_005746 [Exophiala dermatitidis]KAJ4572873.1 hypothetical protein HRR81_005316 [Exophiala dermatitidis]KAJ4583534.1 hypothetical protein HRR82_003826 [Exophiala dermatitidis]
MDTWRISVAPCSCLLKLQCRWDIFSRFIAEELEKSCDLPAMDESELVDQFRRRSLPHQALHQALLPWLEYVLSYCYCYSLESSIWQKFSCFQGNERVWTMDEMNAMVRNDTRQSL